MSGRYTGRHVHHKTMPGGHDATLISITNWLNDVFYQTGALVAYGGTVYISLQDDNYAKTPDSEAAWWATLFILDAADSVKDTHIDWGTGAGQVSAVDVPIADAGGRITGTEVETAIQEMAGAGRTTESIKGNATDLDTHEAVQGSPVHGSTSSPTASKLVHRDASGRAQVAAPSAAADIARKDTVDNHANTQTAGVHGSATAATANKLVHRDASGRAQVATPSADADIATKGYVDGKYPLLHIEDQQTSGTGGGTFTSGAWQTRTLNTVVTNEITGASLASNQITLPAGTYEIIASSPAFAVYEHMIKLRNITDSTDDLSGTSEYAHISYSHVTRSFIRGRLTIGSAKVFEIQHRCTSTKASTGFGPATGFAFTVPHETYTQVWIKQIS